MNVVMYNTDTTGSVIIMSNSKKLLERIVASAKPPNDISPDEYISLVEYLGLAYRNCKGSHIVVSGEKDGQKWHLTVAIGHAKPVDPKAIKDLIEKLGLKGN